MAIYRKSAGSWTTIRNIYRKSGGVWTSVENVYRKASGVWNSVFLRNNSPIIQNRVTIVSDVSYIGDGQFATLTGRNYSWTTTSGLTLTYRFEKSTTIDFASVTLISSGNISNPASGSSNTITQAVYPAAFSQTDMYFRFKVTAVNSSGTTVSVSDVISVSYYGTPVPQSPYPEITGSTTVGNNAFGNIGVWTNSPTSYSYRWYFMSGTTSYPLTFEQSRSVSNKSLSGFTATITTSANHGYKTSDVVSISSVDSLLNKSTATIFSVTNNSFSYTITTPTAWVDAGTSYSSGTYVSYLGNAYQAINSISGVSAYNGGTIYSSGAIVFANSNRYQSTVNNNIGNSVTNTIYWTSLGSYTPTGPQWTLQNFSNTASTGTITGPNYYEGTSLSSASFLLTVPATDYKSALSMIDKALYFAVKAYNPATLSPSEYSNYKLVYGFPIINLGTITIADTSFSIPYTSSYMTKYIVDAKFGGVSVSTYPKTITSPVSPIPVTGLSGGRNYDIYVTPYNGENTAGQIKTKNETTTSAPTTPTIITVTSGYPSDAVSVSFSGGSGPFYQMYWTASATAPTGLTNPDATGTSSPLTDASGPSLAGTYYVYVRSTKTQSYTGIDTAQASPWSAGTQFVVSNRPAIAFSYGTATSLSGGWAASINSGTQSGAVYSLVSASAGSASVDSSTGAVNASGLAPGQASTVVVNKAVSGYNSTTASASGSATNPTYSITFDPSGYVSGSTNTRVTSPTSSTVRTGTAGQSASAPANPTAPSGYSFAGYWRDDSPLNYVNQVNSGGSWTITATNKTFYAYYTAIVPNISQIVVAGNVTAGVTCTVTGTNLGSIEYTFFARDTATSAWVQISAGTAAPSSSTSATIATTGKTTGALPDQYYVEMRPYFGARSTTGAGGGTGTSGTLRSTVGSPKNNNAGSITVNF